MDKDNNSISLQTETCKTEFRYLASPDFERWHTEQSVQCFQDALGRFNVWAANIGAEQPSSSAKSLDYRLRNSPAVHSGVISGIRRLTRSLERVRNILAGNMPNRRAEHSLVTYGEDEPDTSLPPDEIQGLMTNIDSCIDHLFRLSMLMRRLRPKGRTRDLNSFAPLQESLDSVAVMDKFPRVKQNKWLAQKLGDSISQRRQYFTYRQQHRKRLADRGLRVIQTTDGVGVVMDNATTIATTFQEAEETFAELSIEVDSDRRSTFSTATSLVSDYDQNNEMGRRIPDLPDMTLDGVPLEYGKFIECPYCRTIHVFSNRLEWKRHVFSDLQPYTCTFENCHSGLFSTRREWSQHELDLHRRKWQCIYCDDLALTEDEMKAHFRRKHGNIVTEKQTEVILQACERPITTYSPSDCLLCLDWEPRSRVGSNAKDFYRHLARHLQQISLEALPLHIEGLEIRDAESSESDPSSDTEPEEEEEGDQEAAPTESHDEQSTVAPASGPIFGIPLTELMERDGMLIPMVVRQCMQAVELYGITWKDVYIRECQPHLLDQLQKRVDENWEQESLDFRNPSNFFSDVHVPSNLLKRYLGALREPLIPDYYSSLADAAKIHDETQRRDSVHAIINNLSDTDYGMLRVLALHMRKILDNAGPSTATVVARQRDLSREFMPLLFDERRLSEEEKQLMVVVTGVIFEKARDIFDED